MDGDDDDDADADGWMDKWAVDEIEGFVIGRCRQVSFPLSSLSVWMNAWRKRELDGGGLA